MCALEDNLASNDRHIDLHVVDVEWRFQNRFLFRMTRIRDTT